MLAENVKCFNPGATQTLMKILFPDINSVPFALIKTNFQNIKIKIIKKCNILKTESYPGTHYATKKNIDLKINCQVTESFFRLEKEQDIT